MWAKKISDIFPSRYIDDTYCSIDRFAVFCNFELLSGIYVYSKSHKFTWNDLFGTRDSNLIGDKVYTVQKTPKFSEKWKNVP